MCNKLLFKKNKIDKSTKIMFDSLQSIGHQFCFNVVFFLFPIYVNIRQIIFSCKNENNEAENKC